MHAALDAGVTLIDTADAYSRDEAEFGHNEELVAEALALLRPAPPTSWWRPRAGTPAQGTDWGLDGSPAYLRRACEASLRRLGVDAIGLYQFHRPDPATPWEESMGALRALVDDGLVRMVGISNADIAQIDVARAIVGDALRQRAEPVLARLAVLGRRAGALRRRTGWPSPVEPVRRGGRGRLAGRARRRRSPRWPTSSASRSTG